MVYQYPGDVQLQDGNYGTLIVNNEEEEEQAGKDGWFETMADAKAAGSPAASKAKAWA